MANRKIVTDAYEKNPKAVTKAVNEAFKDMNPFRASTRRGLDDDDANILALRASLEEMEIDTLD